MTEVKKIIEQQFAIQQIIAGNEEYEVYEMEACEIISYMAIFDYWKSHYPCSLLLLQNQIHKEEEWEYINLLFIDYVAQEDLSYIEPEILYLVDYFYQTFYSSTTSNNAMKTLGVHFSGCPDKSESALAALFFAKLKDLGYNFNYDEPF